MQSRPAPYANPYLAGIGLGLVLLVAFVVMGHGIGASGAFGTVAAGVTSAVSPERAEASGYLSRYLDADGPWVDWLLVELIGVLIGGALSARLAGRWQTVVARGPHTPPVSRLAWAAGGGGLMGLGAVLARGCTSGQALTGGALLSLGSWTFMLAAFAGGYALAPVMRRVWQ